MNAEVQFSAAVATPPDYFSSIRDRASKRWDQLEADPELAGPWHQLFKQVQSPRHILSELLQNADDAGASEARVFVENDRFVFEHEWRRLYRGSFRINLPLWLFEQARASYNRIRGIGSTHTAWAIVSNYIRRHYQSRLKKLDLPNLIGLMVGARRREPHESKSQSQMPCCCARSRRS